MSAVLPPESGNNSGVSASHLRMNPESRFPKEILDEDLQIVRVTLATINRDVRSYSGQAAAAIDEALQKLDAAQLAFATELPQS